MLISKIHLFADKRYVRNKITDYIHSFHMTLIYFPILAVKELLKEHFGKPSAVSPIPGMCTDILFTEAFYSQA